jgi:hypothetical protein
MDVVAGLVFVVLSATVVALVVSPGTSRALDYFAAGFLPYRSAGWPQGVQEEDPVPWSWSRPGGSGRADSFATQPDVVDIDAEAAPPPTTVHRGTLVPGLARRRG